MWTHSLSTVREIYGDKLYRGEEGFWRRVRGKAKTKNNVWVRELSVREQTQNTQSSGVVFLWSQNTILLRFCVWEQ
jgi:hypothetical protein